MIPIGFLQLGGMKTTFWSDVLYALKVCINTFNRDTTQRSKTWVLVEMKNKSLWADCWSWWQPQLLRSVAAILLKSHATCGISWKGLNSMLWTKVLPGLRSRISKVEMRFRQPRWDFPLFTLDIYSVNAEGCHLHWHPSATFIDNGENHAVLEHLLPG